MSGLFPNEEPGGRYNPNSPIHAYVRRDDRDYGPLLGRKDKWSPQEDRSLLEEFIFLACPLVGPNGLVKRRRRSRDGIGTRIRKLAIHYPEGINYKKIMGYPRRDRTGSKITDRDKYILGLVVGDGGDKYGACGDGLEHVAMILSRSVSNVINCAKEIALASKVRVGFFDDMDRIREASLDEILKIVKEKLYRSTERFKKSFFHEEIVCPQCGFRLGTKSINKCTHCGYALPPIQG